MSAPTTTDYPLLQHVQTTVTSAVDQNGNTFPQSRTVPGLTLPAPGVIPSLSDANAPIRALYWSLTQTALCFKDLTGAVNLVTTTVPA